LTFSAFSRLRRALIATARAGADSQITVTPSL
jgi:hypothetical protein